MILASDGKYNPQLVTLVRPSLKEENDNIHAACDWFPITSRYVRAIQSLGGYLNGHFPMHNERVCHQQKIVDEDTSTYTQRYKHIVLNSQRLCGI